MPSVHREHESPTRTVLCLRRCRVIWSEAGLWMRRRGIIPAARRAKRCGNCRSQCSAFPPMSRLHVVISLMRITFATWAAAAADNNDAIYVRNATALYGEGQLWRSCTLRVIPVLLRQAVSPRWRLTTEKDSSAQFSDRLIMDCIIHSRGLLTSLLFYGKVIMNKGIRVVCIAWPLSASRYSISFWFYNC